MSILGWPFADRRAAVPWPGPPPTGIQTESPADPDAHPGHRHQGSRAVVDPGRAAAMNHIKW